MSTASQPPMHSNYTNSFENTGGGRTHFGAPPSASPQIPPSYPPKPAHVSKRERDTRGIFYAIFNARGEKGKREDGCIGDLEREGCYQVSSKSVRGKIK